MQHNEAQPLKTRFSVTRGRLDKRRRTCRWCIWWLTTRHCRLYKGETTRNPRARALRCPCFDIIFNYEIT